MAIANLPMPHLGPQARILLGRIVDSGITGLQRGMLSDWVLDRLLELRYVADHPDDPAKVVPTLSGRIRWQMEVVADEKRAADARRREAIRQRIAARQQALLAMQSGPAIALPYVPSPGAEDRTPSARGMTPRPSERARITQAKGGSAPSIPPQPPSAPPLVTGAPPPAQPPRPDEPDRRRLRERSPGTRVMPGSVSRPALPDWPSDGPGDREIGAGVEMPSPSRARPLRAERKLPEPPVPDVKAPHPGGELVPHRRADAEPMVRPEPAEVEEDSLPVRPRSASPDRRKRVAVYGLVGAGALAVLLAGLFLSGAVRSPRSVGWPVRGIGAAEAEVPSGRMPATAASFTEGAAGVQPADPARGSAPASGSAPARAVAPGQQAAYGGGAAKASAGVGAAAEIAGAQPDLPHPPAAPPLLSPAPAADVATVPAVDVLPLPPPAPPVMAGAATLPDQAQTLAAVTAVAAEPQVERAAVRPMRRPRTEHSEVERLNAMSLAAAQRGRLWHPRAARGRD